VLSTAQPPTDAEYGLNRLGHGYLDIPALADAVQRVCPQTRSLHSPDMEATVMASDNVTPLALAPDRAYRELLYRPAGNLSQWLGTRFAILARPGDPVKDPIEPGDVILRVVLGRPGAPGHCALIAEPGLTRRRASRKSAPCGWYAVTTAPGSAAGSRSVRVLDSAGVVPPGQLLLRPRPEEPLETWWGEDDPADPGRWTGTTEQKDFRRKVLDEHIARSRKANGAPQRDLRDDELSAIPETCVTNKKGKTACVRTATATAAAASKLLKEATNDLAAAQRAQDPDAQRTVRLSATSGYRGSAYQENLWLDYFATKYYNATRAARAKIPDGPHSDAAVDYMLRSRADGGYGVGGRIAAPGYSNHQGGIAVDLWQERTQGNRITNDSDNAARCRWRQSWFHGWLRRNAATYGFQPIATEEWHWEFRPTVKAVADLTEFRGGQLWTFASAGLPNRVAVFIPKGALGAQAVDVLVFAHGLLSGCKKPKRLPTGLITDAPFELGRVVAESGKPVVLVVPLLDWGNPCGEVVFGRGHERWHPLGDPAHLNSLVAEALTEVGQVQKIAAPTLGDLVVAGHSRAYDVLEPLAAHRTETAMQQGALARLTEVWTFDTTYGGDVSAWTDWLKLRPTLHVRFYYRPGSKTGTVGDKFYAAMSDRLHVTKVNEPHCAIPAIRMAQLLSKPAATVSGKTEEYAGSALGDDRLDAPQEPDVSSDNDPGAFDAVQPPDADAVDLDLSAMLGLGDDGPTDGVADPDVTGEVTGGESDPDDGGDDQAPFDDERIGTAETGDVETDGETGGGC
jgi:LAS superfamily LD-carboxypeptidase LdcB